MDTIRRKSDPSGSPVWVSAATATAPDGKIDWDVLGERALMIYESVLRNTPRLVIEKPGSAPQFDPDSSGLRPECVYYGAAHFDYPNPPSDQTLGDVVKNAHAVLRGRITEITPGFYLGEPNSLLTVTIERTLRSSKVFAELPVYYVV